LAEDMGTRPSKPLMELADRLRRGGGDPLPVALTAVALEDPALPELATPVPAVEADAEPPLYGRQAELARIKGQVLQGTPLIVIVGPAGIGHTRLAQSVARELAPHYADGHVVCGFDAMATGGASIGQDDFIGILGQALGVDLTLTPQPLNLLKSHLAQRR